MHSFLFSHSLTLCLIRTSLLHCNHRQHGRPLQHSSRLSPTINSSSLHHTAQTRPLFLYPLLSIKLFNMRRSGRQMASTLPCSMTLVSSIFSASKISLHPIFQ